MKECLTELMMAARERGACTTGVATIFTCAPGQGEPEGGPKAVQAGAPPLPGGEGLLRQRVEEQGPAGPQEGQQLRLQQGEEA